jgi:hypothetical protein
MAIPATQVRFGAARIIPMCPVLEIIPILIIRTQIGIKIICSISTKLISSISTRVRIPNRIITLNQRITIPNTRIIRTNTLHIPHIKMSGTTAMNTTMIIMGRTIPDITTSKDTLYSRIHLDIFCYASQNYQPTLKLKILWYKKVRMPTWHADK